MIAVALLAAFVAVCVHLFRLVGPAPAAAAAGAAGRRRLCPVVAAAILVLGATLAGVHVTDAAPPTAPAPAPVPAPEVAPDVTVAELPAQPAIVRTIRAKPAALAGEMTRTILALIETATRKQLEVTGPPFARYVTRGDGDQPFVVEVGLPLARAAKGDLGEGTRALTLPGGPAATLVFKGRHEDLPRAHAALDRWLAAHKRRAAGARWEVYLTNPISTPDPAAQRTQIVQPLGTLST